MKYKLLLEDTKIVGDQTLYRIQALKDFCNVKAGDRGEYIRSEKNLSHSYITGCYTGFNRSCFQESTLEATVKKMESYDVNFGIINIQEIK